MDLQYVYMHDALYSIQNWNVELNDYLFVYE